MIRARRRIVLGLTAAMMVIYFGFIALMAWNRTLLGRQLVPGLSLGILLGLGVIVACWTLTWTYVRWANATVDAVLSRHRTGRLE